MGGRITEDYGQHLGEWAAGHVVMSRTLTPQARVILMFLADEWKSTISLAIVDFASEERRRELENVTPIQTSLTPAILKEMATKLKTSASAISRYVNELVWHKLLEPFENDDGIRCVYFLRPREW